MELRGIPQPVGRSTWSYVLEIQSARQCAHCTSTNQVKDPQGYGDQEIEGNDPKKVSQHCERRSGSNTPSCRG